MHTNANQHTMHTNQCAVDAQHPHKKWHSLNMACASLAFDPLMHQSAASIQQREKQCQLNFIDSHIPPANFHVISAEGRIRKPHDQYLQCTPTRPNSSPLPTAASMHHAQDCRIHEMQGGKVLFMMTLLCRNNQIQ